MKIFSRSVLLCLLLAATAGCDRVTKHLAMTNLAGMPEQSFLADTIRLDYHENPGGFLSAGASWRPEVRTAVFQVANGAFLLATLVVAAPVQMVEVGGGRPADVRGRRNLKPGRSDRHGQRDRLPQRRDRAGSEPGSSTSPTSPSWPASRSCSSIDWRRPRRDCVTAFTLTRRAGQILHSADKTSVDLSLNRSGIRYALSSSMMELLGRLGVAIGISLVLTLLLLVLYQDDTTQLQQSETTGITQASTAMPSRTERRNQRSSLNATVTNILHLDRLAIQVRRRELPLSSPPSIASSSMFRADRRDDLDASAPGHPSRSLPAAGCRLPCLASTHACL